MRWGGIFDVDKKLIEITNEEEKTLAPDFWNNAKEAEIYLKNLSSKKKWVEDYEKAKYYPEDDNYLLEFEEYVQHHEVFAAIFPTEL